MIFLIVLLSISILPVVWINYVFKKNDEILPNMPFNGIEFGNQLIKELELKDVCLEKTLIGDHYDLDQRKVKVGEDRLRKKSLTSISIICHEIGHAIQHAENYTPLITRTKLVKNTLWINKIAFAVIYIGLPIIFATGYLPLIKVCILLILLSLFIGVVIHLVTLEVELDASFNKAMPIIKKKIPAVYHDSCRSILRAAAFTYVVGVFKNLISLRMIWTVLSRIR
ncbi:MAG: zinc metallopeptidase [Alphaproteobacteria bacterium]|nr:MAG: zinc metallopeptidase [Alphaproteobacteria bacterium]